jgi:hypothetical protein
MIPLLKPQQSYSHDYGYYQEELKQNHLYDIWNILIKHKWLIIGVFSVIFLSVAVIVYRKTPLIQHDHLANNRGQYLSCVGGSHYVWTADDARF